MDPGYTSPFGDQRDSFYNVTVIPDFRVDGGARVYPHTDYEAAVIARRGVATDVTIALSGVESGVQQYDITARVCVEAGGVGKTMRIYMAEALDNWPVLPNFESRNTLRQGAAVGDFAVAAGACTDLSHTFVFDMTSWHQQNDIKIFAWAQDPSDTGPAEVHQAKVMHWPFTPFTDIFADDFETGTTDAWTEVLP